MTKISNFLSTLKFPPSITCPSTHVRNDSRRLSDAYKMSALQSSTLLGASPSMHLVAGAYYFSSPTNSNGVATSNIFVRAGRRSVRLERFNAGSFESFEEYKCHFLECLNFSPSETDVSQFGE